MTQTASHIPVLTLDGDFFGDFFSHNPSPMWVIDAESLEFLEVNGAAVNIYGYSRDEFLSMAIKDIRPPEEIDVLSEYMLTVGPHSDSDYRWRHIKKDGSHICVNVSSFAVIYLGLSARLVTINDISKYEEQERALNYVNRELKEYKKAVSASSIVSITDRGGIIEYANNNFIALSGYSRDELVGSSHNIINSGYHPRSFWQEMWNTVMKGNTWRGEVCNRKKNGDFYWVDLFIIPVSNEKGRIERLFSIRIDITDRKNKECEVNTLNKQLVAINLELTESRKELERLSLVATLTTNQVFMLDKDRHIVWVNDAFVRQTGYTRDEAYGKLPEKLLHGPDSIEEATRCIKEAIKNRKPFHTEVIHYTKYGEKLFLITDGHPVLDAAGDLLQYVIVETDITQIKQKQQALEKSEIKLNAFFSTTANLHLLVDNDLNILAFNKVAQDFLQHHMKGTIAVGDYLPDHLLPPLHENFRNLAEEAVKGNATINRQTEIPLENGSVIWLVHYLPAHDRNGNIIGCAFTAIDLTKSKKAEDKINRQNMLLKEIAWKQSHVVRAPLANILSISTLLQNACGDGVLLGALKHETEKLDEIIKDIVDKTIEAKMET